jgi:membrane protease YdiL (CAAX protease family)
LDETPNPFLPPLPGEPPFFQPTPHYNIFLGPHGLRAGWRLLLFVALLIAALFSLALILSVIVLSFSKSKQLSRDLAVPSPGSFIIQEIINLLALFFALLVMSRIETRSIDSYGLRARRALKSTFWMGAILGFASLTALLLAIRGFHGFYFGNIGLTGGALWHYAGIWALVFFMVAFWEEYTFRGYAQFVLTRGMGFWPAAIVTSVLFGLVHETNPGESPVGLAAVVAVGLFFCLTLRRTGDLWFAVGFHAAWDYAQTFLYGVPDSGLPAIGHLFNSRLQGPKWLTGGSVGPEGSWLVFVDLALAAFVVTRLYPEAKYPEPEVASLPSSGNPAPVLNQT